MKKQLLTAVCFVLLVSIGAEAAEALPDTLAGAFIVHAKDVRNLPSGAKLVDVRALHDHLSARIPNSLHINYRERSARTAGFDTRMDDVQAFLNRLHKFIPDRTTYFVLYCNGFQCWKSYKAATAAIKDGYQRVGWFRGGIVEWEAMGFPTISD